MKRHSPFQTPGNPGMKIFGKLISVVVTPMVYTAVKEATGSRVAASLASAVALPLAAAVGHYLLDQD